MEQLKDATALPIVRSMFESNWVQQTHQTKRAEAKQLDDGIAHTLVLAVDVRSELEL